MTVPTAEGSPGKAELRTIPLVFMYHSIALYHEDPFEVTMTPQRLQQQMRWLRARGLRGVSVAELLAAVAEGRARRLVGLTFDDGYQDFVTNALPILQRFDFTATVFVLGGRLGGANAWSRPGPHKALLTATQVREVSEAGMEVGSHGLEHPSLPDVDDTRLHAEIVRSREILGELLGRPIAGFAYPYGHLDARVVAAVRAARYNYACAVAPTPSVGRHAIPRTYVHDRDSSWRLDAKRMVSALRVGNTIGLRRYRGGR
jgi:peptidoglycan/xylan/chitin deacetylase (PgdA/CDA1 family)